MRPPRRRHRGVQDAILGHLVAGEHRGDPAVAQDQGAVGDVGELGEVGRVEQDGVAARGEVAHQGEDLGLGADIDAARRIEEEQDPGFGGEQLGQHDLLLVAARQRADGLLRRCRP